MADWPSAFEGAILETVGEDTATSTGTVVTAGTGNAKGSWAQLSSSTPFAADGFFLRIQKASGNRVSHLVDVGVGGAGSEQVILPDLFVYSSSVGDVGVNVYIPLPIPAATRVAARCQASTNSVTISTSLTLAAGSYFSSIRKGRATSYGTVSADSGGTQIDAPGTAHTKSSWVELTSSTTSPITYLIVCVGAAGTNFGTDGDRLLDVGIGAAASEQVVLDNLHYFEDATSDHFVPPVTPYFLSVKSGTRLAGRLQSNHTSGFSGLDVAVTAFD